MSRRFLAFVVDFVVLVYCKMPLLFVGICAFTTRILFVVCVWLCVSNVFDNKHQEDNVDYSTVVKGLCFKMNPKSI